jgi:DNA repair protein RecN (Recombination protein N)
MLRFIRVRNLAVIESVDVEFEPGFNVLTGETGAGKSILIEAVALLLGGRASADLVRTGSEQATVEALFEDSQGGEVVVRREISREGRSRAFVNGTLATAATLRQLAERLVELHGQHEHQTLLDPARHLPMLDEFARLDDAVARTAAAWAVMREARAAVERQRMDARERSARLELIDLQLTEIERVNPKPNEDDELLVSRKVLAEAERVRRLCDEAYAVLYDGEDAVLPGLGRAWKRLGELAAVDPAFLPHAASKDDIKARLEDTAFFLRRYADGIDASPERLQQVEDRLALLERLKRKHGLSLEAILERATALQAERDALTSSSQTVEALEAALTEATTAYLAAARSLSRERRGAAERFSRELRARLDGLGMAGTHVVVRFRDGEPAPEQWGERGIDEAEVFRSANVGEELRPLARTVSGGELSRFMLALKTLRLVQRGVGTMVFDEVDAGIGGRVADVVGTSLRDLSGRCQVLCITHLAQIAAQATTQFRVEKRVRGARTVTTVDRLDDGGRIDEIARMIGGGAATAALREGARDLLTGALAKGKYTAKGESERQRRA